MTWTITKKGQEIEFDSQFPNSVEAVAYANKFLAQNRFISDILGYKKPSEKQLAWIHYLTSQHKLEAEAEPVVENEDEIEEGEYICLVKDMYLVSAGRKTVLKLHLPGGVSISTVMKGPNIGCLYVYENRAYIGKIDTYGRPQAQFSEDVSNLLYEANDNLLHLAQLYGHETGSCSMCGRPLSDPKSIELGLGPVCYKRLQLN